jgi:tetratricopeptide (TPR) repeat protein
MSLHLVVHTWARERVSHRDGTWMAVASTLALSAQGEIDWQPFTPQLTRHLETIFANWQRLLMSRTKSDRWELCRILCACAWHMCHAESSQLLHTCLQLDNQTQELPYHRLSATTSKFLLGKAYVEKGQIPEAIDILERLADSQEELRESDRLAAQHELARAYRADRQITKAIEILKQVVKAEEKLRKDDHPSRLASQYELACAYLDDGQYTKAIEILKQVVKVEEKLREDHPNRLTSQYHLARAYLADEQCTKAIEILERVVKAQGKLREDDPDHLATLHHLWRAYHTDGQYTRAIEILERVVKAQEKLQEFLPSQLKSQHELVRLYYTHGQIEQALKVLENVVTIARKTFRTGHPDRTTMESNLAQMHEKMRKDCPPKKVLPVRMQANPSQASRSPDGEGSR